MNADIRDPPDPQPEASPGISGRLVLLLAIAGGASVTNLYYAQPLLPTLAHAFGVSDATAGLLVTTTQLGYVAGLACWCRRTP